MAADVVYFLPSERARLVLGYLHSEGYTATYKCFLKECQHLSEYLALKKRGHNVPLTINGLSLVQILEEYAQFKLTDTRRQHSVGFGALWTQLDSVIKTLKTQTSLTQGRIDGTSQSARIRRETVQKKRAKERERRKKKVDLCNTSPQANTSSLSLNTKNHIKGNDILSDTANSPGIPVHNTEKESDEDCVSELEDRMDCSDDENLPTNNLLSENSSSCPIDLPPLDKPDRSETYIEKDKSIESAHGTDDNEEEEKDKTSDVVRVQNGGDGGVKENNDNGANKSEADTAAELPGPKIDTTTGETCRPISNYLSKGEPTNYCAKSPVESEQQNVKKLNSCKKLFSEQAVSTEAVEKDSNRNVTDTAASIFSKSKKKEFYENNHSSWKGNNEPVASTSRHLQEKLSEHSSSHQPEEIEDGLQECYPVPHESDRAPANDDINESTGHVDSIHLKTPRRKRPPRKKHHIEKTRDRKSLLGQQNESSNSTDESSVMDSSIPSFLEQILNNTLLHEKLAENINKTLLNKGQHKSKNSSGNKKVNRKQYKSHDQSHDQTAAAEERSLTLKHSHLSDKEVPSIKSTEKSESVKNHKGCSLNTDLNDILDLHETQMSEGQVTGIIEMTKSDPVFESLFNLFAPYTAEIDDSASKMTDFSGIKLEMGKDAVMNSSVPSFSESLGCPDPSNTTSEENLIMEILQSPEVPALMTASDTYKSKSSLTFKSNPNEIQTSTSMLNQPITTFVTSGDPTAQPMIVNNSSEAITAQPAGNVETLDRAISHSISRSPGCTGNTGMSPKCTVANTVSSTSVYNSFSTQSWQGNVFDLAQTSQSSSLCAHDINSTSSITTSSKVPVKEDTCSSVDTVQETFETTVTQTHGFPVLSIKSVGKSPVGKGSQETNLDGTDNLNSTAEISTSDLSLTNSKRSSILSSTPMCAKSQVSCNTQKGVSYNSFIYGVDSEQNSSTPVTDRVSSVIDKSNPEKENLMGEMMSFVSTLEKNLYGKSSSKDEKVSKGPKKKKGRKKKEDLPRSQWSKDLTALMKIASPEKKNSESNTKKSNKKRKLENSPMQKISPRNTRNRRIMPKISCDLLQQSRTTANVIADDCVPVNVNVDGPVGVPSEENKVYQGLCLSMPSLQNFITSDPSRHLSEEAIAVNSILSSKSIGESVSIADKGSVLNGQMVVSQGNNRTVTTAMPELPQMPLASSTKDVDICTSTGVIISSDRVTEAVSALKKNSPCSNVNFTPERKSDNYAEDYSKIPYSENCDFLESPDNSQTCDSSENFPHLEHYNNVATPPLQVLARTAAVKTPLTTLMSPVPTHNSPVQSNICVAQVNAAQPSPVYIVNDLTPFPLEGKHASNNYVISQQSSQNILPFISQSTTVPLISQGNDVTLISQSNAVPLISQSSDIPLISQSNAIPLVSQDNAVPLISQSNSDASAIQTAECSVMPSYVEVSSTYMSPVVTTATSVCSPGVSVNTSTISNHHGSVEMPSSRALESFIQRPLNAEQVTKEKPYIAIPIGRYVPQKMLHVKTLDFGPEAQGNIIQLGVNSPLIRQPGYGRGKKKARSQKKTKVKFKRSRTTSKNKKQQASDTKNNKDDDEDDDFIPDASGSVYLREGAVIRTPVPSPAQFQDTDCSESLKGDQEVSKESEEISSEHSNANVIKGQTGGRVQCNTAGQTTPTQPGGSSPLKQHNSKILLNKSVNKNSSSMVSVKSSPVIQKSCHQSDIMQVLDKEARSHDHYVPPLSTAGSQLKYDDISNDSSDVDVVGDWENPFNSIEQVENTHCFTSTGKDTLDRTSAENDTPLPEITLTKKSDKTRARRNLNESLSSMAVPQQEENSKSDSNNTHSSYNISDASINALIKDYSDSQMLTVEKYPEKQFVNKAQNHVAVTAQSVGQSKKVDLSTPPKKRITAALKSGEQYYYVSSISSQDSNHSRHQSPRLVSEDSSSQPLNTKTPTKAVRQVRHSQLQDSPRRSTRSQMSSAASPSRATKGTMRGQTMSPKVRAKRSREDSIESQIERKSKKVKHKKKTVDLAKLDVDKFLSKIHKD